MNDLRLVIDWPAVVHYFLFEPKDELTLRSIEKKLRSNNPGNYQVISFANIDSNGIELELEFPDQESKTLFALTWDGNHVT
jgi:hypothetical protein